MALQTLVLGLIELAILQARRPGGPGGPSGGGGQEAFGGLCCSCACPLFAILASVPMIIGFWKIFDKAGEPGWASIVPIYNNMVLAKICGKPEWWGILAAFFFPLAIILFLDLAKAFRKEVGFAIGMILLPYVFIPILGFGSAKYYGPEGGRRSRDVDDDYDRPAPRRRARRDDDEAYEE